MSTTAQVVTEAILARIKDGLPPWRMPWRSSYARPLQHNGKPYNGTNVFLLGMLGYASPYFLTYKRAQELGGHVRKGEKGNLSIFAKTVRGKRDPNASPDDKSRPYFMLRYHKVFNATQCEGLPARFYPEPVARDVAPIDACERMVTRFPQPAPAILSGGNRASYDAGLDLVRMPDRGAFESPELYYAVLFHELGHATGAPARMNRDMSGGFGSKEYAREELCAQLFASMLCADCGILMASTLEQSAGYIDNWHAALSRDPGAFIAAASKADAARTWWLGAAQGAPDEATDEATDEAEEMVGAE